LSTRTVTVDGRISEVARPTGAPELGQHRLRSLVSSSSSTSAPPRVHLAHRQRRLTELVGVEALEGAAQGDQVGGGGVRVELDVLDAGLHHPGEHHGVAGTLADGPVHDPRSRSCWRRMRP
jgi:hypothetical protein